VTELPPNVAFREPLDQPEIEVDYDEFFDDDEDDAEDEEFQPVDQTAIIEWLHKTTALPGRAPLAVGIRLATDALRYNRTAFLIITPANVEELNLTRQSAYNGLRRLENAGLLTVNRQRGQVPVANLVLEHEQE